MTPLELLTDLAALPTVPFREDAVLAYVRQWAKARRLRVTADASGNLLVARPTRRRGPRLVLVAHADHPGFTADAMTGRRTLRARFNGYVRSSFFVGSRVRFHAPDGDVVARVTAVEDDAGRPVAATLRVPRGVPAGTVGLWDVGGPRVKGRKFHARVCDDLAGLAAGLAAVDAAGDGCVLVTRGEEEGFVGAIAAVRNGVLRAGDRVVSIECSAEQPYAKSGDGMVVRVGDRTSVFDSAFTRYLGVRADALARADAAFKFQRCLMPGGTCEATVFDAFGYTAAAVCVPLGNYHNMNAATGRIAAEFIDLGDWRSLVALLTDLCRSHGTFGGDHAALRDLLDARYAKWAGALTPSPGMAGRGSG